MMVRDERPICLALASGGTKAAMKVEKGVELRELPSGKAIHKVQGEEITSCAFSTDGSLFAFSPGPNKVSIIGIDGAPKGTLDLPDFAEVHALTFGPDGKRLAVGTYSGLQIWDLAGKPPRLLVSERQRGQVDGMAFSPDGKRLAFSAGPTVRVVNAETGKAAWTVPAHEGPFSGITFSAGGDLILTTNRDGSSDCTARLWRAVDGKKMAVLRHDRSTAGAFFGPDGRTVVTLDDEGTLFAWDAGSGKQLGARTGQKSETRPIFAADHKTFLTTRAKTLSLWEVAALTREAIVGRKDVARMPRESPTPLVYTAARAVLQGHQSCNLELCKYSADGKRLVTMDWNKKVIVWDPTSGKEVKSFTLRAATNSAKALSPDGKQLAFGGPDETIRVWNLETNRQEHHLKGHTGAVHCLAFSPHGRWLASGANVRGDKELFLWDAMTGMQVKLLKVNGYEDLNELTFTPDSKFLLAGVGKAIRLYELDREERPKLEHPETVDHVAVSPDGAMVAAGGGANASALVLGDVLVWDRASGKRILTLEGNGWRVASLAIGPGGLLVVDQGPSVSLWDVNARKLLRQFDAGGPLAVSPDGKTLVVTTGPWGSRRFEMLDVAALCNDRLQSALAPMLALGAVVKPEGPGVRIKVDLWGGPDSVKALAALEGLAELRSLEITHAPAIPEAAVKAIGKLTSLRSLAINSSDLSDEHLKEIAKLSGLVSLELSACPHLTGPGLAVLATLSRLEELHLKGARMDSAGLRALVGLKKLRALSLQSTLVADEGLEVLGKLPVLTELNLGSGIGDEGLAKLKDLKQLRRLSLADADFSDAGLAHLRGMTALEELDLSRTPVTDAGLAHLKSLTNLKRLDLSGTGVSDAGLAHLSALKKLTSIRLEEMPKLTGTGLEHLRGATGITELQLYTTGVTDAGLRGLKDLVQLRTLILPERITDDGLLNLVKLTNLRSINLPALKNVKGPGLAGLRNATALKELDLSQMEVSDSVLDGIKEWRHLEVLELPKTITDAGLARLAGLQGLAVLKVKEAAGVTDAGLAHLKGLVHLEVLDLSGTKITDAGLASLEGLGKLRDLSVDRTGVTDGGAERLKEKLPDVSISRY
jgi:WD40 repeat protein/Leucine-rich repeat (LRR) protein